MKLTFRLNYHTVPGQSLWLKWSTPVDGPEHGEHVVPLRWVNSEQWEVSIELRESDRVRLEYHYQLRQESNGVVLDEWHTPRVIEVDPATHDAWWLFDTWCSAGTVDYAFETNAFLAVLPARGPFQVPTLPPEANHRFQLRMAALPDGHVPCLIGSVHEIGNWGWHSAIPLQEVAANVWQTSLYLPTDRDIEYKYALFDLAKQCVASFELGENRSLPSRAASRRDWTNVCDESYRRDAAGLFRGAGVAMPVFSLRSEQSLGVGEFADLKSFGDWAKGVGLKLIQILPINDTTSSHDWTDSYPYSAISVFALHPLYLRIDDLNYAMPPVFQRELNAARDQLNALHQVDYEAVMREKAVLTRQIFNQHRAEILASESFNAFLNDNRHWVTDYAVFCVKRDHFGTADFSGWEEWASFDQKRVDELAHPDHPEWPQVAYHIWLQSELDLQLSAAVRHLNEVGIALKGDLPIGIDRQSVDAWSAPHLFKMNEQAGAPPDAFAIKGQNWGFPTYHWEVMQRDDYAWWRSRFAQLSRYFDAYRIDHILGFFRIWQVPYDQVEGIMGYFDPALPIPIEEFAERGIDFDFQRFCRPYLRESVLRQRFGHAFDHVRENYLTDRGEGFFQLNENVATQRHVVGLSLDAAIEQGLLDCVSEVIFFEVPGSEGTLFHPRCLMQLTDSYQQLDPLTRQRVEDLYNSYFYQRQEDFWQARGYEKLPAMREASPMLLCGEDLGMVPACVPNVLKELGILSLEIQRMPKTSAGEFFDLRNAPYMSVVSPSTHDMTTLRAWWAEDHQRAARFASQMLGIESAADLSGEVAAKILWQHLQSPAMWVIVPLQDLLAIDEVHRHPKPEAERINVPAIMPYYWRFRMHLGLDELAAADGLNRKLARLVKMSNR
jgi:4-alpha-glucanotransferase